MELTIKKIRDELPTHKTKKYPKRDLSKITNIDLHHSASPQADYNGIETIKNFAKFHVNGHGWPGIGYHYVVAPDGIVYKTGNDDESRWSVGGHNSYTISMMFVGRLDVEEMPEVQLNAGLALADVLSDAYTIPIKKIMGHKEYPDQSTTCPGFDPEEFRIKLAKLK